MGKVVVALFGAAGHMGFPTLEEFLAAEEIGVVKVLLEKKYKRNKLVKALAKKNPGRVEIFYGSVANLEDVERSIEGANYLFNLAAAIPPRADKCPEDSYASNELGIKNIIKALEARPSIKFIDITTVALYGHRDPSYPYIRVGDPLIPGVYDFYSTHKLRGEFAILESDIPYFAIIRQSAMIYLEMLKANMDDGLMFHTPFNDPIEWSTAEDSARLLAAIVKKDVAGELTKDNFWGKIFNLGSGEESRISGYETIQGGFSLFGGDTKDFYLPYFNCTRNFHCGFFVDGEELNNLFHYRQDNIHDYWGKVAKANPLFKLGKLAPKGLIRKFAIERLFKDSNSPAYWYAHNDEARLIAFFGSKEKYEKLPKSWSDFPLTDYSEVKNLKSYKPMDYGFDIEKSDNEITYEDLANVAKLRGGKLLSRDFKTGDVYAKLEWENSDGERFTARPYTILRGGHWWTSSYTQFVWDFDRLAKKDKLLAEFWHTSHDKDEDHCYYFDDNLEARIK